MGQTLQERMNALSESTPAGKALKQRQTERVQEFAGAIEDNDLVELLNMPSGAFKRVVQHMLSVSGLYSQKAHSNSEVYRSEGLEHFPKYYLEFVKRFAASQAAEFLPPIKSPYLEAGKEKQLMQEVAENRS